MPWCDTCDQYLAPPAVTPDGRCPTCGQPVDRGQLRAERTEARRARKDEEKRARKRRRAGSTGEGPLDDPTGPATERSDEESEELPPVPWHFKLLVAAVVIYLGYRFFQLLEWFWT